MQRLFFLLVVCVLLPLGFTRAEPGDPSDLFLNAYMSVQQAEKLELASNFKPALAKYRYAASLLEQVQKNSPDWQPLIVDYRKKKTSESIAKLQEKIALQTPDLPSSDSESVSPPKETAAPVVSTPTDRLEQGAREIRNQIADLQNELKSSKDKLYMVQQQKEDLAKRLDETSKKFDKAKVSEAEAKTLLLASQQSAKHSSEKTDSQTSTAVTAEVSRLQEALKQAAAERDAADEQNAEFARRNVKARGMVETALKERDGASKKAAELESNYTVAQNKLESFSKERDEANKKAAELETKYSTAAKAIKDLETAKAELAASAKSKEDALVKLKSETDVKIATLNKEQTARVESLLKQRETERDAEQEARDENSRKLAGAQKQVVALARERDQTADRLRDLTAKSADATKLIKDLEEAQIRIASLTKDRDTEHQSKDELSKKLVDAEKQVNESKQVMISISKERDAAKKKSETMGTQLTEAQKKGADSERQRAELAKQSAEEQKLVLALTKERDGFSAERNALMAQIEQSKVSPANGDEKKKQDEENGLLRGIVMRQLKEQARRDQARQLVLDELSKLKVKSDVLTEQVQVLGQPVTKLSEKEKALFKQPQMQMAEDHSTASFSMAADKAPEEKKNLVPTQAPAVKTAPASDDLPAKGKSEGAKPEPMPVVETTVNPGVPDEFLSLARKAKEQFELGKYTEAEKSYESILAKVPNNLYALSNLGAVRFREGKLKQAEETFKKAIAIAPEDSFSHCTLGIVYYRENKLDEAITSLTKAIAINPKYAMAHNYLGITASEKGWQENALKEFQTALALDPSYGDANFNLSVIYATQNPPKKELAQKYYKKAISLGSEPNKKLEEMIDLKHEAAKP